MGQPHRPTATRLPSRFVRALALLAPSLILRKTRWLAAPCSRRRRSHLGGAPGGRAAHRSPLALRGLPLVGPAPLAFQRSRSLLAGHCSRRRRSRLASLPVRTSGSAHPVRAARRSLSRWPRSARPPAVPRSPAAVLASLAPRTAHENLARHSCAPESAQSARHVDGSSGRPGAPVWRDLGTGRPAVRSRCGNSCAQAAGTASVKQAAVTAPIPSEWPGRRTGPPMRVRGGDSCAHAVAAVRSRRCGRGHRFRKQQEWCRRSCRCAHARPVPKHPEFPHL